MMTWSGLALWRLWLLIGMLLLLIGGLSSAGRPVHAAPAGAESLAPGAPRVLLINQELPEWPDTSDQLGEQVEMLLKHFTPDVTKISQDQYVDHQLFGFDRVVVVGNDEARPLPSVLLNDLTQTEQPILWLGYGLSQLPVDMPTTYGFSPGDVAEENLSVGVEYHGRRYPAKLEDYYKIRVSSPSVQVLANYVGGKGTVPYIVQSKNLWYVNGLPAWSFDYPDPSQDAPGLIFADVLHDFFGTSVTESRRAVIRLEDVSVHIPPARIIDIVDYLYSQGVPFSVGVIPAQRFKDGSIVELGERPEFVEALRYAQDHGGTIILHGYHHTFGTGEDYEFWDAERNAPLEGETWEMYSYKVEDGIRILRNYGLEPHLWETPHYAGSPLSYQVFSHYFSYAIENRDPAGWLPYPSGPDEYGQMLIPENLGYISPAEGMTVDTQLQRADLLRIVRDSWAVGFLHPVTVPVSNVEELVSGLQQQGYTFVDLRALPTEVRYDYRPGLLTRLKTWLEIDAGLSLAQPERLLSWSFLTKLIIVVVWGIAVATIHIHRKVTFEVPEGDRLEVRGDRKPREQNYSSVQDLK